MRKIIILIIILIVITTSVLAYTDKFIYMIEIMNISLVANNGYYLNEEVFKQYNQLVYGSPLLAKEGQRWKNVENGKWTQNGGAWNGIGIRGEYWILGFDINGDPIHNHQFPVDIEPPTPPTVWRYVPLPNAESSWNDTRKYLYEEQKIYMQTQKLMRNGIVYDITALDIGLDKARAENYATWKTSGNIYTRRYDINNKEWAANFIVPPMAGDAELLAFMNLQYGNEYIIGKDEEEVEIPINFGCEVTKLNEYAKVEHIKEIKSTLIVEETIKDMVSDSKINKTEKKTSIIINKNDFPGVGRLELKLINDSALLTEFTLDGVLTDVAVETIYINIEENKKEDYEIEVDNKNETKDPEMVAPKINSINLKRVAGNKLLDLNIAKKTGERFICAGQVLAIKVDTSNFVNKITIEFQGNSSIVTLDDLTRRFEWDEPKIRGESTRYSTLKELQQAYKFPKTVYPSSTTYEGEGLFITQYVIPYKTKQTLHSWASLRELSKDTFSIDESKLFSRINKPYVIKVKAYSSNGVITREVKLDIFERWDTLYNRDISKYIKM